MQPELSSDYALTAAQVAHYQEKGWVLLRGLATPSEVAAYREVITRVTMEVAQRYKPLEERDTYGKAFLQVGTVWLRDEAARGFTLARRVAKVAAALMAVDGVRLYHDQALYKEAGGGFTPWHQDQQYWPLDGVKCTTLWMPLVDCDAAMGTMRFASGSQVLGYLGPLNISDDSEVRLADLVQERGFPIEYVGDMAAGDVTFHNGWTLHGAPGNLSPSRCREVMTVIYYEDGARISVPDSPQREGDLRGCFPGQVPGELAGTEINPLLYRK